MASALLGLKMQAVQSQAGEPIPHSLLQVTAFLIRENLVTFEQVDAYFPAETSAVDPIIQYHLNLWKVTRHRYSRLDIKILDKEVEAELNREFDSAEEQNNQLREQIKSSNWHLWLVTYLVQLNDFEDALQILHTMWEASLKQKVDITILPELLKAASEQIEKMLAYLNEQVVSRQKTQPKPEQFHFNHKKGLSLCQSAADFIEMMDSKLVKFMSVFFGKNASVFL